ncbi:hypothetical protein WJ542_23630 [Paraburkholderia sp. B3]|uniref:hypothetical protein n=1 Tax=Paraburkholderia sp. B3 TaxID=3134791 RepID=UPI003981C00A
MPFDGLPFLARTGRLMLSIPAAVSGSFSLVDAGATFLWLIAGGVGANANAD